MSGAVPAKIADAENFKIGIGKLTLPFLGSQPAIASARLSDAPDGTGELRIGMVDRSARSGDARSVSTFK